MGFLEKIPVRITTQSVRDKTTVHIHPHIQMCFVLSGTLKHIINGHEYLQEAGSCSFVLPFDSHLIDSTESEDTPVIVHIAFFEEFLTERGYDFFPHRKICARFENMSIPEMCLFPDCREKAEALVRNMIEEFEHGKKMSFDRAAALVAEVFSHACTSAVDGKETGISRRNLESIMQAVEFVENHYPEKITTDMLAQVSGMSRRAFTDFFKKVTMLSPMQFVLSVRLKRASMLMGESDMLFDEIARETGLGDHSNLARVFKKYRGFSPTDYINNIYKSGRSVHAIPTSERYSWIEEM